MPARPSGRIIRRIWREPWQHVIPFLAFEPEVRRVIYITNAIEAPNRQLRKAIRTKGCLPERGGGHQADLPRDPQRRPTMDENPRVWPKAMLAFKIQFGDHLPD
jgi:transposase-like protein